MRKSLRNVCIVTAVILSSIMLFAACSHRKNPTENTSNPTENIVNPTENIANSTAEEVINGSMDDKIKESNTSYIDEKESDNKGIDEKDGESNNDSAYGTDKESYIVDWSAISQEGVNEEAFFNTLDAQILEEVATELQTLVNEEIKAEEENSDLILTEGWTRVFDSEHYKNVVAMGGVAMKPLYWIIYKSPNAGMYEYICATALSEISGYDFTNEDGTLTWTNSKEFLDVWNEMMVGVPK